MTQTADKITPSISKEPVEHPIIPPLKKGDHLTLAEFGRQYDVMPHFSWINTAALNSSDLAKTLSQLQLGLASIEHAAFVEAIEAKANR